MDFLIEHFLLLFSHHKADCGADCGFVTDGATWHMSNDTLRTLGRWNGMDRKNRSSSYFCNLTHMRNCSSTVSMFSIHVYMDYPIQSAIKPIKYLSLSTFEKINISFS